MYESHWELAESPFRSSLDPKYFFASPSHEEALARLHFLVENRRRLGLLLGGRGSGKSLVLQVLSDQLRQQGRHAALLDLVGCDENEFLWSLACRLGMNPPVSAPRVALWRQVTDRLREHRYQQLSTVILLDDADGGSGQVLAQVLRLLQADPSTAARLTIVLASDPRRQERLGERLLDLTDLRIELEPWTPDETAQYLQSSISKAGGASPLFEAPAAARLHDLTGGVPRRVNRLAELSMLAGAGRRVPSINEDVVESVHNELNMAPTAHLH
jgi:type II secretory pathway predicted ATPase ExeA